jgi:hypothetical protein
MAETAAERAERERVAEIVRAEQERQDRIEADMDADAFVVVDHYVTLKVKDAVGVPQIQGFNEGGTVRREDVDDASLRHHLDNGQLVPVGSERARFAGPAGTPKPGEPPNVPVTETPVVTLSLDERIKHQAEAADAAAKTDADAEARKSGRPHGNASEDKWRDYAVSRRVADGVSEEDARAEVADKSKAELVAEYGG